MALCVALMAVLKLAMAVLRLWNGEVRCREERLLPLTVTTWDLPGGPKAGAEHPPALIQNTPVKPGLLQRCPPLHHPAVYQAAENAD